MRDTMIPISKSRLPRLVLAAAILSNVVSAQSLEADATMTFLPVTPGDGLGFVVGNAGDTNGDGLGCVGGPYGRYGAVTADGGAAAGVGSGLGPDCPDGGLGPARNLERVLAPSPGTAYYLPL